MIVAITAQANGWQERADERFGRTKGFFVYNTETDETSFIDNGQNAQAAGGAGPGAAQLVVGAGVDVVITGRVGPKAGAVLAAAGVRVMVGGGLTTVEEAYRCFREGQLKEHSS
jgi:predicted Fe-Mo cluster-binding NifX family protein